MRIRCWQGGWITVWLLAWSSASQGASLCTGTPAECVIVTPAAWVSAFDGYVNTRNAAGLATRAFSLEDIQSQYTGADAQEKIRNFILDAHATWSIAYVLLGGDEVHVPVRITSGIYDNYYFNLSANPYAGSATVLGGRLPGRTYALTQKIANQWANYDGRSSWARDMLYCSWATDRLPGIGKFSSTTVGGEGDLSAPIFSALNQGKGIVAYFGHGVEGVWSSAGINYANILNLANGNRLPFIIAGACLTGKFDAEHCVAEAFFEPAAGGALAYVGANKVIDLSAGSGTIDAIFTAVKKSYYATGRVSPCATYHQSANNADFNFLGDPAAVLDFRKPGDLAPPTLVAQQAGPALITAYQSVSIYATLTDDDEVSSQVWVVKTWPDAAQTSLGLTRSGTSSTFSAIDRQTGQAGAYRLRLHAQDISGNEFVSPLEMAFTVAPDQTPPAVSDLSLSPSEAYGATPVQILATVQDDSHVAVAYTATIVKPDGEVAAASGHWLGYYIFTDTQEPGEYRVTLRFTDQSGNATADLAIVHYPPHGAFRILEDTAAPLITAGWVVDQLGLSPTSPGDQRLVSAAVGTTINLWEDAHDEATRSDLLHTWATLRAPDGTVTVCDPLVWAGLGLYPPGTGYCSQPYVLAQPGFYQVTVSAQDQAGFVSHASGGQISVYVPPTGLRANAVNQQVNLAWVPAQAGHLITGYLIYRDLTPGFSPATPVNPVPVAANHFADTGLINGVTYYYCVGAVDSAGQPCGYSAIVSAVPDEGFAPALPPVVVTALPGDRVVQLSWDPGVPGTYPVSGYHVYRALSSHAQADTPLNHGLILGLTYTDTSVANGTDYFYKIKAQDSADNLSAFSSEVQAVPRAATATPTVTVTPSATANPLDRSSATPTPSASPEPGLDFHGARLLAFPNPGQNQIQFAWDQPDAHAVQIDILNLLGERVATLNASGPAKRLTWHCQAMAPGIYLCRTRIDSPGQSQILPVQKIAITR